VHLVNKLKIKTAFVQTVKAMGEWRSVPYLFSRKMFGLPHSQSGHLGENKYFLPMSGIEQGFLRLTVSDLVTIVTEL
jgi:hypothetical protein